VFYGNLNDIFIVLKVGSLGILITNTFKVLKYGTGEGWRRQIGPIV